MKLELLKTMCQLWDIKPLLWDIQLKWRNEVAIMKLQLWEIKSLFVDVLVDAEKDSYVKP